MVGSQQKSQWPGLCDEINPCRKREQNKQKTTSPFLFIFPAYKYLFVQLNILIAEAWQRVSWGRGRLDVPSRIPRDLCPSPAPRRPPRRTTCVQLPAPPPRFQVLPVFSAHPDPTSPSSSWEGSFPLRHRAAAHRVCAHMHTHTRTQVDILVPASPVRFRLFQLPQACAAC